MPTLRITPIDGALSYEVVATTRARPSSAKAYAIMARAAFVAYPRRWWAGEIAQYRPNSVEMRPGVASVLRHRARIWPNGARHGTYPHAPTTSRVPRKARARSPYG